MRTVKQLIDIKGNEVWSVTPDTSVYEALKIMADKDVGALIVLQGSKIEGIFSERDYARRIILKGRSSRDTRVKEIMSRRVLYVRPEQTFEECMALMTDKHVRHLPVIKDEELLGVISIGDVVKAIISEQKFIIEQLENYIAGRR